MGAPLKRLATAAVAAPLALAAVFLLPTGWFFVAVLAVAVWAAAELVAIGRRSAPGAPLAALLALVPAAALALSPRVLDGALPAIAEPALPWAALLGLSIGALVVFGRTPVGEALPALAILTFGTIYLAVPVACLQRLQALDPWVVFLLLAIVWAGDTAAFYVGTRFGRRRLAPVVSPKKTWEGAAAGLAAAILVTAGWSAFRLGAVEPATLALGTAAGIAGQVGDLVESLLKRSAGVKDSGSLLPGHGGMLDRLDAALFAAPVLWLGVRWLAGEAP